MTNNKTWGIAKPLILILLLFCFQVNAAVKVIFSGEDPEKTIPAQIDQTYVAALLWNNDTT